MPRSARENLHTSFFHVIVQGINKSYIFEEDKYKEEYLKFIKLARKKHNIEIVSYCIMSNHAHLLIYSNNVNSLSMFMKEIIVEFENRYEMQWKEIIKDKMIVKDIVIEIKERIKISNNKLAKYFGINRCTIDRIINR